MKKLLSVLLSVMICVSAVSCSAESTDRETDPVIDTVETTAEATTEAIEETTEYRPKDRVPTWDELASAVTIVELTLDNWEEYFLKVLLTRKLAHNARNTQGRTKIRYVMSK